MGKRLDEEKHTSHLVAMAVTRVSGTDSLLASCLNTEWPFSIIPMIPVILKDEWGDIKLPIYK
jgi:hypothetical protein